VTATPASNGTARAALLLGACLLACFGAGALGGVGSAAAPGVYASLERPPWAPPAWLFGPVWTCLYLTMAVAVWWVVGAAPSLHRTLALRLFGAQLALNALWSWLFFAWGLRGVALGEIVLLWLVLAVTIAAFARVRRGAAWLLAPYLAWVSFAALLNASLWLRNLPPA